MQLFLENAIMKTKSILLAIAVLLCSKAFAYDFSAVCESGQTLYYNITSSAEPFTVEVTFENEYGGYNTHPTGSIIIPENVNYNGTDYAVTGIGNSAFSWCNELTSVAIPNSVTRIGDGAFSYSSNLTEINIPASVTSVGSGVFDRNGWYEAQSAGILYLDGWCLGRKGSIPTGSFNIAEGTKGICGHAFSGCIDMTSVTIPSSVISIGYYAFFNCSGLTSVIIPNSVTSIGDNAFAMCSNLADVTVGESVTKIGESAFLECRSLFSISLPDCVEEIGSIAFRLIRNVQYNGNAAGSPWDALTINGFIEDNLVYSDESKTVLTGCNTLATNVTIPNSVRCIGQNAFNNCDRLTSVTIPDSVTRIETNAFYNVRNIVYHGDALGSPWGALSVNGFVDGELIYSDETKTHLTGCSILATNITIPNSVTIIGDRAFSNCDKLTSVSIGNSVTRIGESAFSGCWKLMSVAIPNSVTSIGIHAFTNTGWWSNQHNDICYLDNWCLGAIKGHRPTGSLTIREGSIGIADYAFMNSSDLTDVTIPESVVYIGKNAFNGCSGFRELTIPNSVKNIDKYAFCYCGGLTSLTIGSSVMNIESEAFGNCMRIDTIYIFAETPPTIDYNTFAFISQSIPVIVPCGTALAYSNAEYWNYFTNIQEDCSSIEETEIADLQIYPNPVGNTLNIKSSEDISKIEIVNVMGQVVYRTEVNGNNAVCDVNGLANGVYVVRIYNSRTSTTLSERIIQRKFIKE